MKYLETMTDQLVGHLGSLAQGTVAVLVVALILTGLNRFLQRNPGHRFRNQSIMLGAVFIGLLLIIIMLPIDSTTRGQLLQLTGIIISAAIALSSGTFISNAMAGIMLKSVRNFRTGDWVKVGEVFGRVSERGLFHTEIQTPDRDLTTLPNLLLATNSVTVVRQSGTIVGATVSLGYDVHHSRIEKLMLSAAEGLGLQDPFVQILELGDFSITYRVAGLLTETKQLIAFRTRLRTALLDALHDGGVEIVSPLFNNQRSLDPDRAVIPRPERQAQTPAQDAAPLDVIFDKAEEAEELSTLEHELETLDREIKGCKEECKGLEGSAREAKEAEMRQKESRMELLRQQIEEANARKKERPPSEG